MDPDAHLTELSRTIQLAVAPVFLLTALGTILNVLSTRLGRIVDRSRVLSERTPEDADPAHPDRRELENLNVRRHLINRAITLATAATLFISLVIAIAFLGFLFDLDFAHTMAGMFIAAMMALIGSLLLFLREVLIAVRTSLRRKPTSVPPSLRP
ncbi:MAG TPA: DUF2721 domain-containing protein [Polyangiaceae bacterium]|nr:DUF2721 domain-containing protein [Polyangiaceae bacterium]